MAKDKPAATPAPTPAPTAAPVPAPAPELTKARVLATGIFGLADDVVELPADVLAQGVAAGQLDPHPDAVAYAAALK
jgi:hypothetical protein